MANSKEKKTNVQMFNEIYEYLSERDVPNEWLEFIDSRIELLTKQAEKSKERKAAKAAEKPADEMLAAVQAELGEKLRTVDDITNAIMPKFPEATRAKVVNRLTRLVKNGVAGKLQVSVGDGKRVMAYALAEFMPAEDED